MHHNRSLTAAALTLLPLLAAVPAGAGPFREIGYDAGTMATANSNVAFGDSIGVLYSNPALLSSYPEGMSVQFIFWKPAFTVELFDKPAGSDVPLTIYESKMGTIDGLQDLAMPTIELKNARADNRVDDPYAYLALGGSFSLGIKGLRLANMLILPVDEWHLAALRSHFATENEQYFSNTVHLERFGEWNRMIDGLFGVSYAPWDFLSFGVAVKVGAATVATVEAYVPDASVQDYVLVNSHADLTLAVKPIVGVQGRPWEFLSLGLVWRHWSYMDLSGTTDMGLWQFHETSGDYTVPRRSNQAFSQTLDYEPMELAGSVGFAFAGFTTQATLTWNMWHFYKDNHSQSPAAAAHFPESPYYTDPVTDDSRYDFSDTLSVAWSGQYRYRTAPDWGGEVKAGFAWSPSPVPAQTGRTSYADSDTLCASLGHRLDFSLLGQRFGFDVGLQYWHMLSRTTWKDPSMIVDEFADESTTILGNLPIPEAQGLQTNNPGFPGYKVSGWMVLASASLRYEY